MNDSTKDTPPEKKDTPPETWMEKSRYVLKEKWQEALLLLVSGCFLVLLGKYVLPLVEPDWSKISGIQIAIFSIFVLFGAALGVAVSGVVRGRREEEIARFKILEIKDILNPQKPNSLLASILKDPDGSLPSTVRAASDHVGQARVLLSDVGGKIGKFKEWGDSWRDKANEALEALKVAYFKKRGLLMEPGEYVGLLDRAREIWNKPQAQVNLCGTMVGFSFLLPAALEKHACKLGVLFARLNLLAVDWEQDGQQQFWYSTYLAADTVKRLCQCNNILRAIDTGHTILVEIRYVDHDLLAAVIEVPKTSITVLQSLDSASFLDILRGVGAPAAQARPQLGYRFDDIEGERDEYDRYSAALQNLWNSFANRSEFWVLHAFKDGSMLKIWNPRWTADLNNPEKIQAKSTSGESRFCHDEDARKLASIGGRSGTDFVAVAATASVSIPRGRTVDFLTELMKGIHQRCPGIQSIEKCFADKSTVLVKLREPACMCAGKANKP